MAHRPAPMAAHSRLLAVAHGLAWVVTCVAGLCGALATSASAQSVLSEGDIAVATTTGVYVLHLKQGAVRVVPGPLVEPAIEWEPDSDRFFVVTGNQLLGVTMTTFATGGATSQILATFPAEARLVDLDVDHSTGDLWVLDRTLDQAHRFSSPVSAGASPDLTLQLAPRTRALSIDSVDAPLTLVYATTKGLRRQTLDGPPFFEDGEKVSTDAAIDTSWQHPLLGSFFADTESHGLYLHPYGPTNFNVTLQFPFDPLIYHPTDVEWLPGSAKLYVVGADGIAPGAFPFVAQTTGVQVVEFRPGGGQVGGVPLAVLASHPQGTSGIFGTQPDLTIVSDKAFAGVYGDPSPAFTGETPLLTTHSQPELGNPLFAVEIVGAPAGRPAYIGLSRSPAAMPVGNGTQLVASPLWMPAGLTDPLGDLLLPASVPNNPALLSMDLYAQAAVFGNDLEPAFTNGLRVRFR